MANTKTQALVDWFSEMRANATVVALEYRIGTYLHRGWVNEQTEDAIGKNQAVTLNDGDVIIFEVNDGYRNKALFRDGQLRFVDPFERTN